MSDDNYISKDFFGNTFLVYDETISGGGVSTEFKDSPIHGKSNDFNFWYHLIEDSKNNNPRKGVLLLGFPKEIISPLRKIYGKDELIYMITHKAKTLYLLINGSNCPQFCDSTVLAAGMTVIIKFKNKLFGILIKDRTKPISTVPGGIATAKEHVVDPNLLITVAKRETYEETKGNVFTAIEKFLKETAGFIELYGDKVYCPGLEIDPSQEIMEIASIFMMSTYYKIEVPDRYKCFGYFIDADQISNIFLRLLFDPIHELSNGNYQMNYVDNDEIDFVYAIQLQNDIVPERENFGEVIEKIITQIDSTKMDSGTISKLHMFFHYLHLKRIQHIGGVLVPIELWNRNDFVKYKLPPSLREIKFHC